MISSTIRQNTIPYTNVCKLADLLTKQTPNKLTKNASCQIMLIAFLSNNTNTIDNGLTTKFTHELINNNLATGKTPTHLGPKKTIKYLPKNKIAPMITSEIATKKAVNFKKATKNSLMLGLFMIGLIQSIHL